jgi:ferredoxin
MKINGKEVLVCNCEDTMAVDAKALAKALGGAELTVHRHLCRAQLEVFERAASEGGPLLVACTQEAPLFQETLDGMDSAPLARFTNIREHAGWSTEGKKAMPKMAALLAEAALDLEPATVVTMKSGGSLLVIGSDEAALEAAAQVAGRLDVTVLLTAADGGIMPPRIMDVPVFTGGVKGASGHLGAFQVEVEGFSPAKPSAKEALAFEDGAQDGVSECDLILDLRPGQALFTAPEKRDGYFNPDPANPAAVQRALLELTNMVGEFEKPRYITYTPDICAHSRSGIIGCTQCLDLCPAGAITPDGDHVAIDAFVCAGCGACASACPTGAAAYTLPSADAQLTRLRTLLSTYLDAGGKDPIILVHDARRGEDMLSMMARVGRGLPANVLPFSVNEVTQIGLDFLLAAPSWGAAAMRLLLAPNKGDERAGLDGQIDIANAVLAGLGHGGERLAVIIESDPDALESILWKLDPGTAPGRGDFLPMGKKRALTNLALAALHSNAPETPDVIELPAGAPFGTVQVDVEGCTVCLACVGACPTGALKDNPDKPQLNFREDACIQCGLCQATCPEKVISLIPRLSFSAHARDHQLVKEEDPYLCIRCSKPFGTKSAIELMVAKLAGHSMFSDEGRLDLLRMCDDCRIVAQMEDEKHPMAGPPRTKVRTTEDDLREREELRKLAKDSMAAKEGGDKED